MASRLKPSEPARIMMNSMNAQSSTARMMKTPMRTTEVMMPAIVSPSCQKALDL